MSVVRQTLPVTVADLVKDFGGRAAGKAAKRKISGFAPLTEAGKEDLCFYNSAKFTAGLSSCPGVVVLNEQALPKRKGASVVVDGNPRDWFAQVLNNCGGGREFTPGIDPAAIVDARARLGEDVHVGAGAVIAAGAVLGDRVKVLAGAMVTEGCQIGDDCVLHEGCVIGAEGFGLAQLGGHPERIRHLGVAVLGDKVEIGANSCVDRGMLNDTIVGTGTKIDNLVQIGHNVVIGDNCVICGHVAIGGSTKLGRQCVIGGRSAIVDHVVIAERVSVMGGSMIMSNISEPNTVYGSVVPELPAPKLRLLWRRLLKTVK